MKVEVEETSISGCKFLHPTVFNDDRGGFVELYRRDEFEAVGIPLDASHQVNLSWSVKDVVRGLHFQWNPRMAKLMRVLSGEAFLVAVDLRKNSPTLGKFVSRVMKGDPGNPNVPIEFFWAPESFARGFGVLSEKAVIEYICTGSYTLTKEEGGVRWNDPAIGIDWPVKSPILSGKDAEAQMLSEWLAKPESDNFRMA
jgi:dTDP-4-dehydrorhamnose 3,5-epimerase